MANRRFDGELYLIGNRRVSGPFVAVCAVAGLLGRHMPKGNDCSNAVFLSKVKAGSSTNRKFLGHPSADSRAVRYFHAETKSNFLALAEMTVPSS